ncbi:MAG: NAD-dependent epimerase/dehydratase family protein [bacterium]|nr:NAD-dependent epimerase/dehydratase family protein [bacterium]
MRRIPAMIVTGASGIVGRHFLEAAKEDFFIYAIARRSQAEAGIAEHPNIKWLQVDITNFPSLKSIVLNTVEDGSIDFVLHLASYYDFTCSNHPEYERTNVTGTRHVLELSKMLKVGRFVFTSSLAALDFPVKGERLTEKSSVFAGHPYALSKEKGEQLVREFSTYFPCSIVRPAAVFTDWGEYVFLYVFLTRWFSRGPGSRILAGKGELGLPYIHSYDLNQLLLAIFRKSGELPDCDTYLAGSDGSTSHRELFETAARFYFGKNTKPFYLPKFLILPIVIVRDFLLRLIGKRPVERPWMLKYLDLKLEIDSSYTRKVLSWEPAPRFHILRRMLYLIEKMKNRPEEWHYWNARAMKRVALRPNLLIYDVMVQVKDEMIDEIKRTLLNPRRKGEFSSYQNINKENLHWDVGVYYQLLTASVRNKDRLILMDYAREILCPIRFSEGFSAAEVCTAILDTGKIIISRLLSRPELEGMAHLIHDYILLTLQLMVDEIENSFERLSRNNSICRPPPRSDIEAKLKELGTLL